MRLRIILLSPLLIVLVLFALSNTAIVPLTLWPTGLSLEAPLSVAILAGMALAFLLGAALAWLSALPHRRRARRAETRVLALQRELEATRLLPIPRHIDALPPALPPPE